MALSRWLNKHHDPPPTPSPSPTSQQPVVLHYRQRDRRSRGYGKVLPYGLRAQLRLSTLSLHLHDSHYQFEGVNYSDNKPPPIPETHVRYYHYHDSHDPDDPSLSSAVRPQEKKRSHGRPFQEGAKMMTKEEYFRKNKGRGYTNDHYDRYVTKFYRDIHGVTMSNTSQATPSPNEVSHPLSLYHFLVFNLLLFSHSPLLFLCFTIS